jgi:hypothetical protein
MKKMIAVFARFALVAGCSGWQIPDDVNTQAIAYASGKGVGAAVNKFVPQADKPLSEAWAYMIDANAGEDPIPAYRIMQFYAEAIALLGQQSADPYGLVSDLTMLLSIYGGYITADGNLVLATPVPLRVARAFELGYKSGKSAVQSYTVKRAVP